MKVKNNKRQFKRFLRELRQIWRISDRATAMAYYAAICASLPQIILSRSLAFADRRMAGRKRLCHFDTKGRGIVLQGSCFGLVREIYGQQCYLPPLEGFHIKPSDHVIDLGANVGVFTMLAANTGGKVIAVEAQSELLEALKVNLNRNNIAFKVTIVLGLVGAGTGIFSDESKLKKTAGYAFQPPKLTMQQILRDNGIEKVDFLKMDIEGSEFDLLRTDNAWLERVEKIAMEVHQQYGDINKAIRTIEDYGFRTWMRNKYGDFVNNLKDDIGYLFALNPNAKTYTRAAH